MPLFPRVRLRAICLHVRDTLRVGLNAQITQAIAETSGGDPPASGLATFADTTEQIVFGDDPDYDPVTFPSIRIANPRVRMSPIGSATVTDAVITFTLGVYTEQIAGPGECAGDIISPLSETTLDLVESARACIERDYPSNLYGSQIVCQTIERIPAPQDPENPCSMRMTYLVTFQATTRLRQSRGATT